VANRDLIRHHIVVALYAGQAEADGNEELSRCLHAETKFRLINMSDEELWELAKLTASPPERPVELIYEGLKQAIEEHRATAGEWTNDLTRKERLPDRILIIDDEPSLSKELVSALTRAGFSVAHVPNYLEALLKLDEFKPDIIIMDEVLPSRDGIGACAQLRSNFGIPIILLGKDSTGKQWAKAVEAGADFYLKKPFGYRELVARVKAILRRYQDK